MASIRADLSWAGLALTQQRDWYAENRGVLQAHEPDNDLRLVRTFNFMHVASRNKGSARMLMLWSAFCSLYATHEHYIGTITRARAGDESMRIDSFLKNVVHMELKPIPGDRPTRPRDPKGSWLPVLADECREDMLTLYNCLLADRQYLLDAFGPSRPQRNNSRNGNKGNGRDADLPYEEKHAIEVARFKRALSAGKFNLQHLQKLVKRIYFLRGHVAHGAVGPQSGLNHVFQSAGRVLSYLLAIIVQVVLERPKHDWGDAAIIFAQDAGEGLLQDGGIHL